MWYKAAGAVEQKYPDDNPYDTHTYPLMIFKKINYIILNQREHEL